MPISGKVSGIDHTGTGAVGAGIRITLAPALALGSALGTDRRWEKLHRTLLALKESRER